MVDVTNLDDYRPHIQTGDPVTGVRHVVPVAMLKDVAEGKIELQDQALIRALVHMLYEEVSENCDP